MTKHRCTWLALLLCAGISSTVRAEEMEAKFDLTGFPKIEGRVTAVHGSMNSFLPPVAGERITIDLSAPEKLDRIPFTPPSEIAGEDGMHYISLAAGAEGVEPLRATSIRRFSNGGFNHMRLLSRAARGGPRVMLDIVPLPGSGDPSVVQVWIVLESDVTQGVVVIEGKALGEFPKAEW